MSSVEDSLSSSSKLKLSSIMRTFVTVILLAAGVVCGYQGTAPMPESKIGSKYSFSYVIKGASGNMEQSRSETRDESGTRGEYQVYYPGGSMQSVSFSTGAGKTYASYPPPSTSYGSYGAAVYPSFPKVVTPYKVAPQTITYAPMQPETGASEVTIKEVTKEVEAEIEAQKEITIEAATPAAPCESSSARQPKPAAPCESSSAQLLKPAAPYRPAPIQQPKPAYQPLPKVSKAPSPDKAPSYPAAPAYKGPSYQPAYKPAPAYKPSYSSATARKTVSGPYKSPYYR